MEMKSDFEFIEDCLKRYPELSWLVGDCNTTPEGNATLSGVSWAARFFPHVPESNLAELNRTLVGLLVFRWVMTDQYEKMVECQPDAVRISSVQFEIMKRYVRGIIQTAEEEEAMVVFMIINDLGKIKSMAAQLGMEDEVDHDAILAHGLTKNPSLSPSFVRLNPLHQSWILSGLQTLFNMGQFMQAENVPASLAPLASLDQKSLNFYLLHAFFDIAGAAGHVKWNGSMVMNMDTYVNFMLAVNALQELPKAFDLKRVYWSYVQCRWIRINVKDQSEKDVSARFCCMLRISKQGSLFDDFSKAYASLPFMEMAILNREMDNDSCRPVDILLYYSPALLVNAHATHGWEGIKVAMQWMARVFQETRTCIVKGTAKVADAVCTILVADLAQAAKSPTFLMDFHRQRVCLTGNKATLEKVPIINLASFPRLPSLEMIPGKCIVPIGIGGGSDVIQAAQLAMQLRTAGKVCPCVISIRTAFMGTEKRVVNHHGGEIAPNVFRITAETSGNGRFLESAPVDDIPVYLILADISNETLLMSQVESILSIFTDSIDTLVAVDTGGDALDIADTQSQDVCVMRALLRMKDMYKCILCEIAVGVDAPPDAEQKLMAAKANYMEVVDPQSIIALYEKWHMIGPSARSFGKTPLAWVRALSEEQTLCHCDVPLPSWVVNDYVNPWNPFIHVQPCMKGMFFLELNSLFC